MSLANALSLKKLLEDAGMTKGDLAAGLGVSRQTIQRMGDKVSDDALMVIQKKQAVDLLCKPAKRWEITHQNIALSRIKYGREGMAIDDVAALFGLSVFEYNREVDKTVEYCGEEGTSFVELRG